MCRRSAPAQRGFQGTANSWHNIFATKSTIDIQQYCHGMCRRIGNRMLRVRFRALAVVICGVELASCSSMPGFNAFKPKPTTTLLLIQSSPPAAEARTSLGKTCRTPCTMQIGSGEDFTVSFSLNGYMPQTLTVHATMSEGGFTTAASPVLNPTSLFATLEPVTPQASPRKPSRQRPGPAAAAAGAQQ
jgi:hypothetical protein